MHNYVHLWSPNDGDRNQQNNQLLGLFCLYNMILYWLAIPFMSVMFSVIQVG